MKLKLIWKFNHQRSGIQLCSKWSSSPLTPRTRRAKLFHWVLQSPLPLRIKEEVEKKNFNIPVCVQSLSYDSCPLNDDASLEAMRIRSGDSHTLHITYPAKGNCEIIRITVKWFERVRHFLLTEDPMISNKRFSPEFDSMLSLGLNMMDAMVSSVLNQPKDVSLTKLYCYSKDVNKLFFVSCMWWMCMQLYFAIPGMIVWMTLNICNMELYIYYWTSLWNLRYAGLLCPTTTYFNSAFSPYYKKKFQPESTVWKIGRPWC